MSTGDLQEWTAASVDDIERKAEQAEAYLSAAGVDLEQMAVVRMEDLNGPITETDDKRLELRPGMRTAMAVTEPYDLLHVWNSGYDINTLRDRRAAAGYDASELALVGEHGNVVEYDGETVEVGQVPPQESMAIDYAALKQAADENVKLLYQPNESAGARSVCVEGGYRAAVDQHPLAETAPAVDDLLERLDGRRFRRDGDSVSFRATPENAYRFRTVVSQEFPYAGMRYGWSDDGSQFTARPDRIDDEEMELADVHRFTDEIVAGTDWETAHNDDYGSDLLHRDAADKWTGAKTVINRALDEPDPDEYVLFMVGDSATDIPDPDVIRHSLFFPQETVDGEQSAAYTACLEQDIPHMPVEDAREYARILNTVLDRASG